MNNVFQLFADRRSTDIKEAAVATATRNATSYADLFVALKELTDAFCICMEECSNDNVDVAARIHTVASQAKDLAFIANAVVQLKAMSAPVVQVTTTMKRTY